MGLEAATYISQLVTTNPVGATDPKSQGDDHLRLIKAALKNTFPNFTAAALNSTQAQIDAIVNAFSSTDPGATAAPSMITDRNSASPAVNDLLGEFIFRGRSSTAVVRDYAKVGTQILDPTNASEDAALFWQRMVAGTLTTGMTLATNGLGVNNSNPQASLHVGAGADAPATSNTEIYATKAGQVAIVARDSTNDVEAMMLAGTSGVAFGSQTAHDVLLSRGNTTIATWAASAVTLASNYAIAFAGTGAATTRTNLGLGALATQANVSASVVENISHMILVPTNQDYFVALKMPYAGTINETVTKCSSGTCTATFKIDGVALGGTANAVSSTEQTQAQASANTFSAGQDITVSISSNASCLDLALTVKITRTVTSA